MKKIGSLILATILFLSIFVSTPITVSASVMDYGDLGSGVTWELDDVGVLTISGTGNMKNYYNDSSPFYGRRYAIFEVVISEGVTSIGDYVFYECEYIDKITIPDSVTKIGNKAFYKCYDLESIDIPDSVTEIGGSAFYSCEKLESVKLPNCDVKIGEGAFSHCKSLKTIDIPLSVTQIGEYAFSDSWIESIVIPDTVTTIGSGAFSACRNLTQVELPKDITSIPDYAFYSCKVLPRIAIPEKVETIGAYAFMSCEILESVTIPDGVTEIGESAFSACNKLATIELPQSLVEIDDNAFKSAIALTEVNIPENVTQIGMCAFYQCKSLKTVNIPKKLEYMGIYPFYGCAALLAINVAEDNAVYSSVDGVLFDKDKTTLLQYCSGSENKEYTIPDTVTKLDEYSFRNAKKLESVVIPDSVTEIVSGAFYGCQSLSSVVIPDSVTSLGDAVFYKCIGLKNAVLGSGIRALKENLFYGCTQLESVTIPKNVRVIQGGGLYSPDFVFYEGTEEEWADINIVKPNIDVEGTAIHYNATGHTFSDTFTVDSYANCTEDGSKSRHCLYCNGKTDVTVIPAEGHDLMDWTYDPEPTCTTSGWRYKRCANCMDFVEAETLPATGHTPGEWEVSDSTCTSSGRKVRKCTVCGVKTDDVFIPSKGHTESDWIVDVVPTCTSSGQRIKKCTVCSVTLDWETLPATGHIAGEWETTKKATVNNPGEKQQRCTQCNTVLDTKAISQKKCKIPEIKEIANKGYGVRFEWAAVEGADSYKVYRKVSGGSYKSLGTTTKTAFADKTAKSGTKYYYVVKAVNEAGTTEKSASKSILFVASPVITAKANKDYGIKIVWSAVKGADSYKVYRKVSGGSYELAGTTTQTYFKDKKAKAGTTYYYVVKAVKSGVASYKSDSVKITFLCAPTIKSGSTTPDGISVNWNKISGASGYYVYRKASSGGWKKIATVKGASKVKYLDETPRKGATYQYKVKAYYGDSVSYGSDSYKIKCRY